MTTPGEHLSEEPQDARGAPGSRDTGSDEPSGGPVDRPAGDIEGAESVPAHSDPDHPDHPSGGMTTRPPADADPEIPPYEGRKTSAEPASKGAEPSGAETGGATKPVTDPEYKSPPPDETPGGATASPGQDASKG